MPRAWSRGSINYRAGRGTRKPPLHRVELRAGYLVIRRGLRQAANHRLNSGHAVIAAWKHRRVPQRLRLHACDVAGERSGIETGVCYRLNCEGVGFKFIVALGR